jgi:outer membrane protein
MDKNMFRALSALNASNAARAAIPATVAIAALLFGASAAQAQGIADKLTIKLGAIEYKPDSKTNGISGIGIPAGADATVGSATTLLITAEYAVMPNVGIELVIGVPPKIKATATGTVAFLGEVLSARIVAPTVLVNYHFGSPGDSFRPYVGVGVNYTRFTGASTPYGWKVELGDSVGLAGHIGADYSLNKSWGLFGSIGRANVKSKLVATGAVVLQSEIDFRPTTYALGAYYRF